MSSAPTPRPKRWIWFFVVIATLAAAGLATEIWSNLSQQLTPEKLAAARAVWQEKGPRDYVLNYDVKRDENPDPVRGGDRYTVRVTDGKGTPARAGEFGSMDDLFDRIDAQLRADREPGSPRAFVKATFDPDNGHVIHYVHSVMKTRQRLEVTVTLRPITASPP
jgi:hypothetical protein